MSGKTERPLTTTQIACLRLAASQTQVRTSAQKATMKTLVRRGLVQGQAGYMNLFAIDRRRPGAGLIDYHTWSITPEGQKVLDATSKNP